MESSPLQYTIIILHGCLALFPWIVAIFVESPIHLMIGITIGILILVQYIILGECILTQVETPGAKDSLIILILSDLTKSTKVDVRNAVTLMNNVAPIFYGFSKLARLLEI